MTHLRHFNWFFLARSLQIALPFSIVHMATSTSPASALGILLDPWKPLTIKDSGANFVCRSFWVRYKGRLLKISRPIHYLYILHYFCVEVVKVWFGFRYKMGLIWPKSRGIVFCYIKLVPFITRLHNKTFHGRLFQNSYYLPAVFISLTLNFHYTYPEC